ncbi:MAG: hypothetical protein IPN29_14295 [Saprospiraceae bacterium]|nr:hypothetical protein [Saprospiraceae bacterium]
MSRNFFLLLLLCVKLTLYGQHHEISAKLLPQNIIEGKVVYRLFGTSSPLKLKLTANGYANANTMLADSLLNDCNTGLHFSKENERGKYEMLEWKINGEVVTPEYNETKEIATFSFTKAINELTLECNYLLKLPALFNDLGYSNGYTMLTHWFPEVLNTHSDLTEVSITLPDSIAVFTTVAHKTMKGDGHYTIAYQDTMPINSILISSLHADTIQVESKSGKEYTMILKPGARQISESKLSEFLRVVDLNAKYQQGKTNYLIDDKPIKKLHGITMMPHSLIKRKPRSIYPVYRYTDKGNHMVGLYYSNMFKAGQKVHVILNPHFSFKNDFTWRLAVGGNYITKKSKITLITPSLTYSKFHYFTNEKDNYTLAYHRISPSLRLKFKGRKWLNFNYVHILERNALYTAEGIEFNTLPSSLYRLAFQQESRKPLSNLVWWTELDHLRYKTVLGEEKMFTKFTTSIKNSWKISTKKNFQLRLFAAYFLQNDGRESSNFSDFITKGSIALIHQGQNDYAYDELFVARKNQDGIFDNQVSSKGGGFKNAPANTSSLGESNDFAYAINCTWDFFAPAHDTRAFVFGDWGGYRQWQGDAWKMKNLYSAGLGFTLKDKITFYLPLINHADINQNYRDNDLGFLKRWSFQFLFKDYYSGRN